MSNFFIGDLLRVTNFETLLFDRKGSYKTLNTGDFCIVVNSVLQPDEASDTLQILVLTNQGQGWVFKNRLELAE